MLSTQIMQYDPLISDTACHTRAPCLIGLSRKSKDTALSKDELEYLESCRILTETQYRQYDIFGIIVDEKTDNNRIPAEYLSSVGTSNTKKNTFLAKKKSEVATQTLRLLQENCKKLVLHEEPISFTDQIPTMKQRIPVIPLYYSAKMMLHYAAKQDIPLIVNLKRVILIEEDFSLDGAISIAYRFNTETGKFSPEAIAGDQEGIAIDMVSCYVENTEQDVSGFLASSIFQLFIKEFLKEDLSILVMLCAVSHCQYPQSAERKGKVKWEPQDEGISTEALPDPSAQVQVNLNECTRREFKQLEALASRYGFFAKNTQGEEVRYIERDEQGLIRTNIRIPLYVDHVYTSTIENSQAKTALLMANRDSLKVPRKEAFNPEHSKLGSRPA